MKPRICRTFYYFVLLSLFFPFFCSESINAGKKLLLLSAQSNLLGLVLHSLVVSADEHLQFLCAELLNTLFLALGLNGFNGGLLLGRFLQFFS
jgi:hypothetical protein